MVLLSVADPDGQNIRIRIRDEQPGSYFRELRNSSLIRIRNLFDPGSGMEKIRIGDKHSGSATLV
jgi:hypothetical protein